MREGACWLVTDRSATTKGMLQVALAASLWGTWSLFLRPAALPATITAPLVISLVGLFVLPAALREPRAPVPASVWRWVFVSAALEALNVVTFFAAMTITSNAVAVLTHYFAPVLVALLAPWVDKQRVAGARVAALLAISGLALVLQPWNTALDRALIVGATLGTVSAFGYAGNVFVLRRLADAMGPARAQFARCLLAGALLIPVAVRTPVTPLGARSLGIVVLGAIIPGAFAGLLFARGLPRAGAARASVLTYLEPLVSVLLGILLWNERANAWTALGCAMVIAAGVVVSLGNSATKSSS